MAEKSAYQRVKEERCQHCKDGMLFCSNKGIFRGAFPCTAPTIEEFCEEQAKQIVELEQDKARLDWLEEQGDFIRIQADPDLGGIKISSNGFTGLTVRAAIDAARGEHDTHKADTKAGE